jgi:hypothetical protein
MLHRRCDQQTNGGSHCAKSARVECQRAAAEVSEAGLERRVQMETKKDLSAEDQQPRLIERCLNLAMVDSDTDGDPPLGGVCDHRAKPQQQRQAGTLSSLIIFPIQRKSGMKRDVR